MPVDAAEDHGDDYTNTDHYDKSQDFDDLLEDDEAHDGKAPEQDYGSPHQDESINDKEQYDNECCSRSDHSRCAPQSLISDSSFDFQTELSDNSSDDLCDYSNTEACQH